MGDFRHPHGALPKCRVSPPGLKGMLQTTACPSRTQGDNVPVRKHPSQSQAITKNKSHGSALVGVPESGLSLAVAVAFSQARCSGSQTFSRGWKCPTPRALHARPGCCCRLHPAGPALGLAPRAESSKLPLLRQSGPGFCRGCRAPPRPGWGRKSGVRGGTGALQELSDPSWVGDCTITPLRGWGWELRAALPKYKYK